MRTQIDALFPAGSNRLHARMLFGVIEKLMTPNPDVTTEELKRARLTAFTLILFTAGRFHAGQLIGGKSDQTKGRVLNFILSLLRFVGFHNVPDLSPSVLSDDGIVAIVQPQGEQKVAPPSGDFMAVFFDNTVSQTTLVTGAQLQTATTPGSGPLPTDGTPQFPVFVRWTATNLDGSGTAKFNNSPALMHCAVVEEAFHPHEAGNDFDNLRLGRRNPDNGTVQVFPAASQERLIALAAQINPATGRPYMTCENASTDIQASSGGSGVLWLAQRGLKTAGSAFVRLFAPKPLYAFTFLVGCDGGIDLTGFSDWGIVHVNRPVEEVDLGATTTTLELGSSQTVTAMLADGYELDPSVIDSKLTNPSRPGDPVTAFEQREYTVAWSSSNSEVVSVEPGDGHTATITAHSAGPATITASIDGATAALVVAVVGPDLTVTAVSHSPVGANSEDPLTFNVTVQNIGQRATSVPTALQLRFSDLSPVGFTSVPAGFAAGASQVFQVTHSKLPAGTYTIHAIADFTELQRETNEGNNTSANYAFTIVAAGPPVITSVVLNSTTLVIGGPAVGYTATLNNPGGSIGNTPPAQPFVLLQTWIEQGTAKRGAGGGAIVCGSGLGVLPTGTCTEGSITAADNTAGGTGVLVPGPATFVLELKIGSTVLDTKTIAVTLTAPGVAVAGTTFYSTTGLPNITVELIVGSVTNEAFRSTTTDGAGHYGFSNVPPGTYHVKAYGPDASYITWVAHQITVAASNVAVNIDIPKDIVLLSPESRSTVFTANPILTWTANPQAVRYVLQLNITNPWTLVEQLTSLTTATYTVATPLLSEVNYTWQVDAYDATNHRVGTTEQQFNFTYIDPGAE